MADDSAELTVKGLIGQGAFGSVYLVENKAKEEFAVKIMPWTYASDQDRHVAENELTVLQELESHENVLVYVDSFVANGLIYIVTEYCSGGDLSSFLDQIGETDKAVPEDLLLAWLWQMTCGLEFMHTHDPSPVLHRDLKPSNVYLSDTGDIRLGDMGIARILDDPSAMASTFCGTPPYMSPEALQELPYNAKTDVWSLGCCVVEMATLDRAYTGSTLHILRNAVLKTRSPLPREYGRELDDIVSKMLCVRFDERAAATDILNTQLLQDYQGRRPLRLLERHKLLELLVAHQRPSPPSAKTPSTIHTLTESLSNLKDILDEGGEPISSYRVKVERRMSGRRQDSTLRSSSVSLATVLSSSRSSKSKTVKLKARVPTSKPAPEPQLAPDDSLSRTVLSSLTTSLVSMRSGSKAKVTDTSTLTTGDSSRSTQVVTLRTILTQMVGLDTLREATILVTSVSSREELMVSLAALLGDPNVVIINSIVYLVLTESVSSFNL